MGTQESAPCPAAARAQEICRLFREFDRLDIEARRLPQDERGGIHDQQGHLMDQLAAAKLAASFAIPTTAAGAALHVELLAALADLAAEGGSQAERLIGRHAWAALHYLRRVAPIPLEADASRDLLRPDPFATAAAISESFAFEPLASA